MVWGIRGSTFGLRTAGRGSSPEATIAAPSSIYFFPTGSPAKFRLMSEKEQPRFWHIHAPDSNKVTESYCLGCCTFVGASQSAINLWLVESLHRARCKELPQDGADIQQQGSN